MFFRTCTIWEAVLGPIQDVLTKSIINKPLAINPQTIFNKSYSNIIHMFKRWHHWWGGGVEDTIRCGMMVSPAPLGVGDDANAFCVILSSPPLCRCPPPDPHSGEGAFSLFQFSKCVNSENIQCLLESVCLNIPKCQKPKSWILSMFKITNILNYPPHTLDQLQYPQYQTHPNQTHLNSIITNS